MRTCILLETIRNILLKLKPTGTNGFEGLVSEIIYEITGIPSRLAQSGTQFGIDGNAIFPADSICFEAKLYSGKLDKDEIITKVATLGTYKEAIDLLWVLGATTSVSTQDADLLRKIASKDGIFVLILDWQKTSLPLLAIALAISRKRSIPFITRVIQEENISNQLNDAFDWLERNQDYCLISEKLRSQFNAVEFALVNARKENKEWLRHVFSLKSESRSKLGQPITPLDNSMKILPRNSIVQMIEQELKNQKRTIFLLGEEGCGKSWIAASVASGFARLSIFISAEHLKNIATEEELKQLIISSLAIQCGQSNYGDVVINRWHKRLDGLKNSKESNSLLVILDGLNQRPDFYWDKIINKIRNILDSIGGQLIVTTRNQLFIRKIKQGLSSIFLEVSINNWSDLERDELLHMNEVSPDALDPTTAMSLLNPRLLGIALEVLPKSNLEAWQSLTVDRLLFEYLRLSQRDNIELSVTALAKKLSDHASQLLEKLKQNTSTKDIIFQSDTESVAEGRFFEVLNGPSLRYRLKPDGLTLALGYALIDRVWEAHYDGENLNEVLSQLLEPITALDRTVEVVLASLTICALDELRFDSKIFATLLDGFSKLQNPDIKIYIPFRDICFARFETFLVALEDCFLDKEHRVNKDWFKEVVMDGSVNDAKWLSLSSFIHNWFSYFSKNPEHSLCCYSKENIEDWNKKIKSKKIEIDGSIAALSPFEKELFLEMQEMDGNIDALSKLGMELLVNKPLVSFARSFLKWGVYLSINGSHLAPRSEFHYLTNFNQIDWSDMCKAFRQAIEPLANKSTSTGGQWTVVRMLYATGTHEDAKQAAILAAELTKDRPTFKGWRLIEDYCSSDPCDPTSEKPDNITLTAKRYAELDVNQLYTHMSATEQNIFREDALLGIARFIPDLAISKHKQLLATLPIRTELSLRQLSLNGKFLMPLIDEALANNLFAMLVDGRTIETLSESDRPIVAAKIFWFISSYLSAKQQLEVMCLPTLRGFYYLLDMTKNFKPFEEKVFGNLFIQACEYNNKEIIIPISAFLQYTDTVIDQKVTKSILKLIEHPDALVRYCIFKVILKYRIVAGYECLSNSKWSFDSIEVEKREAWYGSLILIEAVKSNIVSIDAVFKRCSIKAWISSLDSLEKDFQYIVIKTIDSSLEKLINNSSPIQTPPLSVSIETVEFMPLPIYKVDDVGEVDGAESWLLYKTDEEFLVHKKILMEVFNDFYNSLDVNAAILIVDGLNITDIDGIAKVAPRVIKKWFTALLKNNDSFLKNVSFLVAYAYCRQDSDQATLLFQKAMEFDSFVNISYGNGLFLDHVAIWHADASPSIDDLRRRRLDYATNDHQIAMEVLAAETYEKEQFILDYVFTNLKNDHPYIKSRAIMVAGFSNQTDNFSEYLENAARESGLVGDAAKVALEAHKRCCWTKYWAKKMIEAQTAEEFWCISRLLVKISDGRLKLFLNSQTDLGVYWTKFKDILMEETNKRSEKWKKKREETFLGYKSVDLIFIR